MVIFNAMYVVRLFKLFFIRSFIFKKNCSLLVYSPCVKLNCSLFQFSDTEWNRCPDNVFYYWLIDIQIFRSITCVNSNWKVLHWMNYLILIFQFWTSLSYRHTKCGTAIKMKFCLWYILKWFRCSSVVMILEMITYL